jgi:acyl-CoA synthetase (AMP-forming)/AMP-acid ligase II
LGDPVGAPSTVSGVTASTPDAPPTSWTTPDRGWNYADIWEHHAGRFPDAPAQAQGDRRFTWADFDARANGIAHALLDAGVAQQDKVAQYLHNCPEYLESVFACFKAGLVPVNTNYRYTDAELIYLWTNSESVAVVFQGTFAERIAGIRDQLPGVTLWLWVDDGSGPCPVWATAYETAAAQGAERGRAIGPWGRSGDDLYFLYTGGTTGMPKGVMWRQDDAVVNLDASSKVPLPDVPSIAALEARAPKPGPRMIPGAPLMHGTGAFNAFQILTLAGCIHTLTSKSFDAVELLDVIDAERINSVAIVGDAFAKPILRALDAQPERWDISSLKVLTSSGVMWSAETKAGLLRHHPRMLLIDSLGSSEAIGMATSISTGDAGADRTATFRLGPGNRVVTDDGRDVAPGSGERGRVALRGRMPLGYYKDATKTASTFMIIDGVRYSIPGDFAEVEADGTVKLLGRGSVCINTGGEKVYPEEVEEVLKLHPGIHDAVVVGVPDERFGEAITAVVEPVEGGSVDEADVIAHVKAHLAAYKAPKQVFVVPSITRAPNGKVDYRRWKSFAAEQRAATGQG